jgi:ABC-type multidrug transport system fused ATPase/permease subunit
MTQDQIEGELINLREQVSKLQQRQEFQQTKSARWALAFFGVFFVQFIFIGVTWFTSGKANPGEYGVAMTFMFIALAFGSFAQPGGSVWSRPK